VRVASPIAGILTEVARRESIRVDSIPGAADEGAQKSPSLLFINATGDYRAARAFFVSRQRTEHDRTTAKVLEHTDVPKAASASSQVRQGVQERFLNVT